MNRFATLSWHEVLNRVAAPTPAPGGGAVAAMTGALGTALAEMVAGLPRTRHDAAAERDVLDEVRPRLLAHRMRLEALADLDAAAFERLLAAVRLPSDSEAAPSARVAEIADATKGATLVPLDTAQVCADVLTLMGPVARAGHRAAASDVRVAIGLLRAAAEGAADNVRANLETFDEVIFTTSARQRLAATLAEVTQAADAAISALHG